MDRLGPYEVLEYLADDPPWRVYRGRQPPGAHPYRTRSSSSVPGGEVLLRLLTQAPANQLEQRALEEGRRTVALRHPNIERLIEWEPDELFCVQKLALGWRLHLLLDRPLPSQAAYFIAHQVGLGLEYLHQQRELNTPQPLVHGNVRPQSVLITTSGEVLLKNPGLDMMRRHEPTLASLGPPAIVERLSPEQATGQEVDWRSDLFQLGQLLDETLTARPVFRRGSPFATITAITSEEAEPTTNSRPELAAEVDELVARTLQKAPEDRLQSAAAITDELTRLLGGDLESGRERLRAHIHGSPAHSRPRIGGLL